MTTRPPAPPPGANGPYPQLTAWGPPSTYPIPPHETQPPAPKKKHTGLILGLSGVALIVVIVLVAGVVVLATRDKTQTTASTDPTVTATYAGETSPWVGHLPDPCKDFPAEVVKSVGLDPETTDRGPENQSYTVQRTCQYFSHDASKVASVQTSPWGVSVLYQSFSYQEVLRNRSRDSYRAITINGQPATFFHIIKSDLSSMTRCDLSIGTSFGNANFVGVDDITNRLRYDEVCRRTLKVATSFQPYLSHDLNPK